MKEYMVMYISFMTLCVYNKVLQVCFLLFSLFYWAVEGLKKNIYSEKNTIRY